MTVTLFTTILMVISALTSLFTEGIKKVANVKNPNIVAICVSIALTVLVGITYPIMSGTGYTTQFCILMLWECVLASLCSMVGYDKVIQTLKMIGE